VTRWWQSCIERRYSVLISLGSCIYTIEKNVVFALTTKTLNALVESLFKFRQLTQVDSFTWCTCCHILRNTVTTAKYYWLIPAMFLDRTLMATMFCGGPCFILPLLFFVFEIIFEDSDAPFNFTSQIWWTSR